MGAYARTQAQEVPTFSVIIPVYNRAELVTRAVRSVLDQTHPSFELIVIDDGSTDGTPGALAPYLDRLHYVRQDNRGFAAARNRGIREARGELLAFLDSDDRFEPRFLEAVHATFQAHPDAGAVFSAERELDESGRKAARVRTKRSPGPFFTTRSLVAVDTLVGCGRPAVVRRPWVERLGGFDERIPVAADCEMWIRYSFHMQMVLQPEPLVVRYVHDTNISSNQAQDAKDWLCILDRLADEHPEFVRANRLAYRRSRGKNLLRYGREVLARPDLTGAELAEARSSLAAACRTWPLFLRAHVYLLWSYLGPSAFHRWRHWQTKNL